MPSPLAKQVLFAAGGDVAAKYGTAVWRKAPPTAGGEIAYTFTRTGNGLYLANDVAFGGLKVLTASGGNLRLEQLVDPISLQLQNYLKLEPAGTNSCLQSQTLATSPWVSGGSAGATMTNNAGTAPDGTTTATSVIPTAVSGTHNVTQQSITITSNEFVAASIFLKAITYTGAVVQISNTGAPGNGLRAFVDLSNGTLTSGTLGAGTTLSGAAIIALGSGWYWIGLWGSIGNSLTTAALTFYSFDTYAHAQGLTAFTGDGVSGMLAWGAQLERNGTAILPPTSYILTTAGPANRNVEGFSVPWYYSPGAMWLYIRWLERGGGADTSSTSRGLVEMGDQTARLMLFKEGPGPGYRGLFDNGAGVQVRSPTGAGLAPTFGQVGEALVALGADGSVAAREAINQAADTVYSQSGADLPFASTFGNLRLSLGTASAGGGGTPVDNAIHVSRVLVGTGSPSSIADVRNLI